MQTPSTPAASARFRARRRVRIGHGWKHAAIFVIAPIAVAVGVAWFSPSRVGMECRALEGGRAHCRVVVDHLLRTHGDVDHVEIGPKHLARVQERGSGSDRSYFLVFPNGTDVSLSRGHAKTLASAANAHASEPVGTLTSYAVYPAGVYGTLVGTILFMLFGLFTGRSSVVELDESSGLVRVLQSGVFGPPREKRRVSRSSIEGVRTRTLGTGDSTQYQIELVTPGDAIPVFKSAHDRSDKVDELVDLLGVQRLGAR